MPHDPRVRSRGVGVCHSTDEVAEQCARPQKDKRCGGDGGKGGRQGELRVCANVPDSEPDSAFPSTTSNALAAGLGGTR
jgi:hypothetical protein